MVRWWQESHVDQFKFQVASIAFETEIIHTRKATRTSEMWLVCLLLCPDKVLLRRHPDHFHKLT